ncbi:hypothetical protein [Georgenia sp. AZ-5]|uniref:hypothetical protein n=1 Tax=Georgenia sp. AZ-5 TaxID=3367526 RepID=UPI0037544206
MTRSGGLPLLEHLTGPNRTPTTARLILFGEASHDASLRAALTRARTAMDPTVAVALAHLGARDPVTAAQAVIACFEGLLLRRIGRHETDPRPLFGLVVRGALA